MRALFINKDKNLLEKIKMINSISIKIHSKNDKNIK